MRPAGRAQLDSLYFDYPAFPFRRPPELDGVTAQHPVIIAGAGPIGLIAAIALAQHGIASVLLERKNTVNDGSRAICVSRHSFETLQQLGAVAPFLAKGLGWTKGRCYYRDQLIYQLEMPHSEQERFLPMYNIQQQFIEQYLIDKAGGIPRPDRPALAVGSARCANERGWRQSRNRHCGRAVHPAGQVPAGGGRRAQQHSRSVGPAPQR